MDIPGDVTGVTPGDAITDGEGVAVTPGDEIGLAGKGLPVTAGPGALAPHWGMQSPAMMESWAPLLMTKSPHLYTPAGLTVVDCTSSSWQGVVSSTVMV